MYVASTCLDSKLPGQGIVFSQFGSMLEHLSSSSVPPPESAKRQATEMVS